jgi:hypothetical protein
MVRIFIVLLFSFFFLLISDISISAESSDDVLKNNTVSLNIGGGGALYGLNYDKAIKVSNHIYISPVIGIGATQLNNGQLSGTEGDILFVVSHSITTFFGTKDLKPEIGFGGTYAIEESVRPYLYYPSIGFRWHPKKSEQFQLRLFGNIILNDRHSDYQLFSGKKGHYHFSRIGLSLGVRL